ncbi:MAG: hypothetical protein Q4D19_07820 [Lautropia sp.]|nr:hypothetical protein [Lautropia sp.]
MALLLGLGGCGSDAWEESEQAKQLREKCGNRHQDSSEFLYCAVGTYAGKDQVTGRFCSTTINADNTVSFINGSTYIKSFKVMEEEFKFEKPRWTTDWTLLIKAASVGSLLSFSKEKSIELTVDTKASNTIRIRQVNRDTDQGDYLNSTCVTNF